MGEEEVERLIADLLLAAIDTTSVTALWLLYVLATEQTVQVQTPCRHNLRYSSLATLCTGY